MKTFVTVVIMVATGTVSAVVVMAWTGIYFSTHPSTYDGGVKGNDTSVILPNNGTEYTYVVGVGPYDVDVEEYDLDIDEVNWRRKEKIKEVNKLVLIHSRR